MVPSLTATWWISMSYRHAKRLTSNWTSTAAVWMCRSPPPEGWKHEGTNRQGTSGHRTRDDADQRPPRAGKPFPGSELRPDTGAGEGGGRPLSPVQKPALRGWLPRGRTHP